MHLMQKSSCTEIISTLFPFRPDKQYLWVNRLDFQLPRLFGERVGKIAFLWKFIKVPFWNDTASFPTTKFLKLKWVCLIESSCFDAATNKMKVKNIYQTALPFYNKLSMQKTKKHKVCRDIFKWQGVLIPRVWVVKKLHFRNLLFYILLIDLTPWYILGNIS